MAESIRQEQTRQLLEDIWSNDGVQILNPGEDENEENGFIKSKKTDPKDIIKQMRQFGKGGAEMPPTYNAAREAVRALPQIDMGAPPAVLEKTINDGLNTSLSLIERFGVDPTGDPGLALALLIDYWGDSGVVGDLQKEAAGLSEWWNAQINPDDPSVTSHPYDTEGPKIQGEIDSTQNIIDNFDRVDTDGDGIASVDEIATFNNDWQTPNGTQPGQPSPMMGGYHGQQQTQQLIPGQASHDLVTNYGSAHEVEVENPNQNQSHSTWGVGFPGVNNNGQPETITTTINGVSKEQLIAANADQNQKLAQNNEALKNSPMYKADGCDGTPKDGNVSEAEYNAQLGIWSREVEHINNGLGLLSEVVDRFSQMGDMISGIK